MKKEKILEKVSEDFDLDNCILVILFGNRNGADTDLFILLNDDSKYYNTSIENLDITHMGIKWLDSFLIGLDPLITEPILTGEVIKGNTFFFEETKRKIKHNDQVPFYLYQRAILIYEWTLNLIEEEKYKEALINISFIHSYLMFLKEYLRSDKILTFQEICNKYPVVVSAKKRIKNHSSISAEFISCLLIELEEELTKSYKLLLLV